MSRQFGALRGMAILLVLLNHSIIIAGEWISTLGYPVATGWQEFLLLKLTGFGRIAVPTFLFISGTFVTYVQANSTLRETWKRMVAILNRLLWPYLIWSIVFYLLLFVRGYETFTALEYLKHMLTGFPYHFIPILIFYYVVSPVLAPIIKRYGVAVLLAIFAYQVLLIALVYPAVLSLSLPAWLDIVVPPALNETLADWAIYFPLGIAFSQNKKSWTAVFSRWRWPLIGVAVVLYLFSSLPDTSPYTYLITRYLFPLSVIPLLALVNRKSIPQVRWFEKIGKRSYGLYLVNLIVLDVIFLLFQLTIPAFFQIPILVWLPPFLLSVQIPLWLMEGLTRTRARVVYRYVFG